MTKLVVVIAVATSLLAAATSSRLLAALSGSRLPSLGSFGMIRLAVRTKPPKLPRFKAPKSMTSRVFKTKKDKAMTRQALKKALKEMLP